MRQTWRDWTKILQGVEQPLCVRDTEGHILWANSAFGALSEADQAQLPTSSVPLPEDPASRINIYPCGRETQSMLEALVQGAPVAIIALHLDLSVALWNPAAEAMFGWAAQEVLGRPYPLVPDFRRKSFEELRARVMGGHGFIGVEDRRLRRDGSLLEVSISTAPMRDAQGRVVGSMVILEDITHRLALLERLRHSERLEALGRFAGGVAHDFNNALTVILNTVRLLRRREPWNWRETDLDAIESVGGRSSSLVQQLLAFGRKQVLRPGPVDLNQCIEGFLPVVQRLIGEQITVKADLSATSPLVYADPSQLEHLVLNLAANARDAMPQGGLLTLSTRSCAPEQPEVVELSVSDSGIGIPADQLPHIFDPFYTTKPLGQGVGLGLASVYGAVQQSKGEISVESEVGKGTTFRIRLRHWQQEAAKEKPPPKPSSARRNNTTSRVLLVEDDALVRGICVAVLRPLGFSVLEAQDGPSALSVLESQEPLDLLMTDVVMPGMSGRVLAERCRVLRPTLPILLVSGHPDDVDLLRDLPLNTAFLSKPFSLEELESAIGGLLPLGEPTSANS